MKRNGSIRVEEAWICLLCEGEGLFLYKELRDRLFNTPGVWNVIRCPFCGLAWLGPRPIPEDIEKLYDNYFTHDTFYNVPRFASLRKLIRNAVLTGYLGYNDLAGSTLQKRLGRVLSWIYPVRSKVALSVMFLEYKPKGKLLEVGCGNGQFLNKMRELGWEVAGVELDGQAIKIARERFGLRVHGSTLEEADFPDDTFDAITMDHVIEHIWDPIGTLKECCRVLKPNGRLVVLTPNIKSLAHRLFREAWLHLDPPRHLYLFSPYTLHNCAERAGLGVLKLRTTARSVPWIWLTSRLIRRDGLIPGGSVEQAGFRIRLEGRAFQIIEHGLCLVTDVGEELVLIATKSGK